MILSVLPEKKNTGKFENQKCIKFRFLFLSACASYLCETIQQRGIANYCIRVLKDKCVFVNNIVYGLPVLFHLYFLNMLEVWFSAICSHFPPFQASPKSAFQSHFGKRLAHSPELLLEMSL